ncbi:hypothetical protein K439DRAFT_1159542 [Ramaria rubella]|nr:hypothetical protein K439DRAFT_1159542 [Ramaria rubella]
MPCPATRLQRSLRVSASFGRFLARSLSHSPNRNIRNACILTRLNPPATSTTHTQRSNACDALRGTWACDAFTTVTLAQPPATSFHPHRPSQLTCFNTATIQNAANQVYYLLSAIKESRRPTLQCISNLTDGRAWVPRQVDRRMADGVVTAQKGTRSKQNCAMSRDVFPCLPFPSHPTSRTLGRY